MAGLAAKWGNASAAEDDAMAEKNYQRRVKAVQWVDKEIRKLIAHLQANGGAERKIKFGPLFDQTADTFEALSGTLVAAKKRGVVAYDGQLLMQKMHDNVVISLLKDAIDDSPLPVRDTAPKKDFFNAADANKPQKCAVCTKTVYPSERVSAINKIYHKQCFTCTVCKGVLSVTNFCSMNGAAYCNAHYEQEFKAKGGQYAGQSDKAHSGQKQTAAGGGAAAAIMAAASSGATAGAANAAADADAEAAKRKKAEDDKRAAAAAAAEAEAARKRAAEAEAAAAAEERKRQAEAEAACKREADADAARRREEEAARKREADAEAARKKEAEARERQRLEDEKRAAELKAQQDKAEAEAAAALKAKNEAEQRAAAQRAKEAKEKAEAQAKENARREAERIAAAKTAEAKAKAEKEKAERERAEREKAAAAAAADKQRREAKEKADREKAERERAERDAKAKAASAAAAAAAANSTSSAAASGKAERRCSKCSKPAPNATAKFCSSCSGKIEDVFTAASDSASTPGAAAMVAGAVASADECGKCAAPYRGPGDRFCQSCGTPRPAAGAAPAATPSAAAIKSAGAGGPAWMQKLKAQGAAGGGAAASAATAAPAAVPAKAAGPTCTHPGCRNPSYGKFCEKHAPAASGKAAGAAANTAAALGGMIKNAQALAVLDLLADMDDDDNECALCYAKFGPTTLQHHCGFCGMKFDAKCFDNKLKMCKDCIRKANDGTL